MGWGLGRDNLWCGQATKSINHEEHEGHEDENARGS